MSTPISVLWTVGTAVAASADDARLAAATDGEHLWQTLDGGRTWLDLVVAGAADVDADPDEDDDTPDADPDEGDAPSILGLAFLGDELLVATPDGLRAGRALRSPIAFTAICVDDGTIYGTTDRALLRSEDAGHTFRAISALPGPVHSLAVAGGRILAATGVDVYLNTDGSWRPLAVGPAAVAGAPDGTLWRAALHGIEQSTDGERWRPVATARARAIAVGAGDGWVASGKRILRLAELDEWERLRVPVRPVPFDPGQAAERAGWSAYLPEVALLARVAEGLDPRPREVVVAFTLSWDLEEDPTPNIHRTAAELLRRRRSVP